MRIATNFDATSIIIVAFVQTINHYEKKDCILRINCGFNWINIKLNGLFEITNTRDVF